MKYLYSLISVVILLCLVFLSITYFTDTKNTKKTKIEATSVTSFQSTNGQELLMINMERYFEMYFTKIKDKELTQDQLDSLFEKSVVEPFTKQCYNNKKSSELESIYQTPTSNDQLALEDLMDNMKHKKVDGQSIEEIVKNTLLKVSEDIGSSKKVNACIIPTLDLSLAEGVSAGTGYFTYFYKSNAPLTKDYISSAIAHEYTHSVDSHKMNTVLDYLLKEGKAVYVQKELYPAGVSTTIYEDQKELWESLEIGLLDELDSEKVAILNGKNGVFPVGYVYSEGYKIINSLMEEEPDLKLKDMIDMDSQLILKRSNYNEKMKTH